MFDVSPEMCGYFTGIGFKAMKANCVNISQMTEIMPQFAVFASVVQ